MKKIKETKKVKSEKKIPWGLISFICPIVGLVLYFLWKDKRKQEIKNIATCSIIGACIWLFFGLSLMITSTAEPEKVYEKFSINDWYTDIMKDETVVTVIGSTDCPHCQEYKPVIYDLAEKKNFKFYFFELEDLSQEDITILTTTVELQSFDGSVPYTFITKSGKFVVDTVGYMNESVLETFLLENKVYEN